MQRWEYVSVASWWEEVSRSADYLTQIQYRHVWQPGPDVVEFANGMTANFGDEGWELVTILTSNTTLLTTVSPQGNDGYSTVPVHRVFFKRPVE